MAEWQTQRTQNPPLARACGFDSHFRHQSNTQGRDELTAQGPTITVEHVLRPLVVVMAGENEFDPYKD